MTASEANPPDPADDDPEFPSGAWTGFYFENGARHRQDMHLTFRDGALSGSGDDAVGRFAIRGLYDAESKEVRWNKRYLGAHDVYYRGFREIKGIWGTWSIGAFGAGFHIWPVGEGEAISIELAEELPATVTGSR